jgi:hypothetical protein
LDLEAEVTVFACDRRRQFIEALKRVIGNFQVDGRKVQFVGIDGAVVGEVSQRFDVRRRFVEVVHCN